MSENKMKFGITTETKDKNNAPILVATEVQNNPLFPSGWKFPIATLVNVIHNPEFEKKDGSKVTVLQFVFRDKDSRQYIHTEWELETNDEKFSVKLEGMNSRIKHIYTAIFSTFPEKGIGADATGFSDFFAKVAKAFNSVVTGEETKVKVYSTVKLFIKLTYYKKNLGFPLSPNFLEKAIKGQPCKLLTINLSYDNLKPSGGTGSGALGNVGDMPSADELPSFDNQFD